MADLNKNKCREIATENDTVDDPLMEATFYSKLRKNAEFRQKFLLTLAMCWFFLCLGWNVSQLGPTLPDLQLLTNTELDEASYFLTTFNLGFLVGALSSGWILKKINPIYILCSFSVAIAIATAVTPWCNYYNLTIFIFLFRGVTHGVTDAGCNILVLKLWGVKSGPYMQALHFAFAFGAIISPLATVPFLISHNQDGTKNLTLCNDTQAELNNVYYTNMNTSVEPTGLFQQHSDGNSVSNIHGAFVISTILTIISSVFFSYFICFSTKESEKATKERTHLNVDLPRYIRIVTLIFISSMFFFVLILEKTISFFLTTFTIHHLNWPKALGSYATSAFWGTFALGRLTAVGVAKILKAAHILLVYSSVIVFASFGLLITNIYKVDVGIWIFVPICGFCQSVLFPLLFAWVATDFFKVSGKMVSVFMFVGSIGSMTCPIMLGYLIEMFSPMWFCYIIIISSFFIEIVYFILLILSRKINFHTRESESVFVVS